MFGKKTFLEPHIEQWALDTWGWLHRNLGGQSALDRCSLVLPNSAFFPRTEARGHARATEIFRRVKGLMGLESWTCQLESQGLRPIHLSPVFGTQTGHGAAGTFRGADGRYTITYDPDLLSRPYAMISTFAHECSHYVLHRIDQTPPGAEDEPQVEELATDLTVAFHGFGIIAANAAFEFEQFQSVNSQGWSSRRLGYLTEDTWVFLIALFLTLRGERPEEARKYLKPHLAKRLDKALGRLEREPALLSAFG